MARIANKLHRQVARHLGSEGAAEKMTALAAVFREKPEIFSDYMPLAEGFSGFLESIEESYNQYEDKNKMAIRNLQLSSEELNKVNRKLEFLNNSMNAMLESLGPGLLFFDREGLCSPVFSKSCSEYLGQEPGGRYIWEVLDLDPSETANFKTLMTYISNNQSAMSFDDLMSLAPRTKTWSEGRVLHIEYRPMKGFAEETHGVLVIITDRTHEERTRKLLEEKEKAAGSILRLARNRNGFQQFMENLRMYFLSGRESGYLTEQTIGDTRRAVHTFKGLAGVFFAEKMTSVLHQLEESLQDKDLMETQDIISGYRGKIAAAAKETLSYAETLFGRDFIAQGETKMINAEKLRRFNAVLAKDGQGPEISRLFFTEFLTVPIHEKLEALDYFIQELSQRLGKKVAPSRLEGENFPIADGPYNRVMDSLVHIVRNIADHGIEPAEIRTMLKKPEAGQVAFKTEKFEREKPWFRLTITDDGAGIDKEKVRARLLKNGVESAKSMGDADLLQQVFKPGFSMRDNVSGVSGRGIGLNAVYEEIKKLGGAITVESTPGTGARFIIELPLL